MQLLQVPDWNFGIDTSKPPTEIAENAAQDILNLEFDQNSNLATRSGVDEFFTDELTSRVTSLHYFTAESGEVGIIVTSSNKIYLGSTSGGALTDKTSTLTLPSDTFWQWKTFGGLAVGVNKATTGDNPIKMSTGGTAAALGGSPPKGKYIEIWNNRVWIASATEPNQVWGSALGLPEDWTVDNDAGAVTIDVDADDGDEITGLFATRDRLYVFKRKRIFRIVAADPSQAATLATNLKVELHAQNVGCVSGYSIQSLLDDVVFLSELGLASLNLAPEAGDYKTALYSTNVAEIQRMPKTTSEIPSLLVDNVSQYWLSIPATISTTTDEQTFVMDYAIPKQARWTRFDGLVSGTAFTSFVNSSGKVYLIGSQNSNGDYKIYLYNPQDIDQGYDDDGAIYNKWIKTKAYITEFPLIRKHWYKWAASFSLYSASCQLSVNYYFDDIPTKGGTYSFTLESTGSGSLWDIAEWDVGVWDSAIQINNDIVRNLLNNSSGKRSQSITFMISNAQTGEDFTIKELNVYWDRLTEKQVREV